MNTKTHFIDRRAAAGRTQTPRVLDPAIVCARVSDRYDVSAIHSCPMPQIWPQPRNGTSKLGERLMT